MTIDLVLFLGYGVLENDEGRKLSACRSSGGGPGGD